MEILYEFYVTVKITFRLSVLRVANKKTTEIGCFFFLRDKPMDIIRWCDANFFRRSTSSIISHRKKKKGKYMY